MSLSEPGFARRRVFRVAGIELDEATQELMVDGQRRVLEAKPMALLQALLSRAGARVGKRALIEAVWGNADHISETSLTTAMSKLRAALGERGRDLIDVVPGSGYRIAAAVEVSAARPAAIALALKVGDSVPGRPQWRLTRLLGTPALNDVWLAEHEKTGEARVFKFADSAFRLATLRREAALSRVLQATLGARDDLVRIAEWNFDDRPYFMESPYGGLALPGFAAARGGLAAVPMTERLSWLARIARTLAAAHGAGVLHGDIKPANILVVEAGSGPVAIRLVDFGAGGLSDPARLAALAISMDGVQPLDGIRNSGTLRYMAPEVLAGGVPTTAADIYALGILLFQLVVGDLNRSLALGYEAEIEDPLLRDDIEAAACGDPARRLESAAALADRLETLPARRMARQQHAVQSARAASLAREVERARLRRPWIRLAAGSMVAGLALATWFGLRAMHERDQAQARAVLVQAVNAFLTEDLLGRGNPANSGTANETLMDAAQAAEAGIDRRLSHDPMVAGAIYLSLAGAFDSRSAYGPAHTAYDRAIAAFDRAGRAGHADAVIASLHEASMVVASGTPGSMEEAQHLIAVAAPQVAMLGERRAEAQIWLDAGRGMVQMLGGDVRTAQREYARAADAAAAMPLVFDIRTRLGLRQSEAFTYMRLGQWAEARALFEPLLQQRLAVNGPRHADTLMTELRLAQIDIGEGQPAMALQLLNRIHPDFVSVFGATHLDTLLLLATRAQALSEMEQYDAALADQKTIYQLGVTRFGDHSYIAVGGLADSAATQCRTGQMAAGLVAARQAHDLAVQWFGAAAALTEVTAGDLALCLIVNGHDAEALPMLAGIDPKSAGELAMDPQYGAELDLMRAAAALGVGQTATGTALLSAVGPAFEKPGADPFMRRWIARLRHFGT